MSWNDSVVASLERIVAALGVTVDRDGRTWNDYTLALLSSIETSVGATVRVVAVTRSGASGAGATTASSEMPAGARVARVRVAVEQAFNASATAKVGFSDDDDALIGVADLDATTLSTLNAEVEVQLDVPASGTRKLVVTTTGSSTQGSLRVTAHYGVPES